MFIITGKEDNVIINSGESLDYMSNGYPRLTDKNIAFPDWMVDVHEVDSIPDDVVEGKYCYTKADGFYLNQNWVEPDPSNIYNIPDEIYHQIIDDYTMEILGGETNE